MAQPRLVIFDMDDVLCRYDLGRRLRALAALSGRTARDIRAAIWDSGFEDQADSGGVPDADLYLSEFARRMGHPLSVAQWVDARRQAMVPDPAMLEVARAVAREHEVALFTNNGPLTEATIDDLFPELRAIFGDAMYFSWRFGVKKPSPESFRRLLTLMGRSGEDCLFIDDKKSNVRGAEMAGISGHHFLSRAKLVAALAAGGLPISESEIAEDPADIALP